MDGEPMERASVCNVYLFSPLPSHCSSPKFAGRWEIYIKKKQTKKGNELVEAPLGNPPQAVPTPALPAAGSMVGGGRSVLKRAQGLGTLPEKSTASTPVSDSTGWKGITVSVKDVLGVLSRQSTEW